MNPIHALRRKPKLAAIIIVITTALGMKYTTEFIKDFSEQRGMNGNASSKKVSKSWGESSTYKSEDYILGSASEVSNEAQVLSCARWMAPSDRKVLLVGFQPISEMSWMTEEYHMSLNLVEALLHLGFDLEHVDLETFESLKEGALGIYHRIFMMVRLKENKLSDLIHHGENGCKIRLLIPDINANDTGDEVLLQKLNDYFHEKQILVATAQKSQSTELGFTPFLPKDMAGYVPRERNKIGTIILPTAYNDSSTKKKVAKIIQRLSDMMISLHILRRSEFDGLHTALPSEVISHDQERLSQTETLKVLSRSAFLLSFDNTRQSPLSTIAMSLGVSVINLTTKKEQRDTPGLSKLGMPYMYTVNGNSVDDVVEAVHNSLSYRFASHIVLNAGEIEGRICASLEDDSICLCPDESSVDCRSSFYTLKQHVFHPIG